MTPTKEQLEAGALFCLGKDGCDECPMLSTKDPCIHVYINAYRAKCAEVEELRRALREVGKRGANPITQYGYGIERPWCRLADDVWEIARKALEGKE